MGYLETLRSRRVSPRAVEHTLRMSLSSGRYGVYLIVEGEEDEEYYSIMFQNIFPDIIFQVIVCDGKGGVLGLRDFADREYPNINGVSYFIDRDHDDFLGIDHARGDTYVTDGYSIEWEVCNSNIIGNVFRKTCIVGKSDPLFSRFMEFVLKNEKRIMRRFYVINVIAVWLRMKDEEPELDELTIGQLFRFYEGSYIKIPYTLGECVDKMGCNINCTLREIRKITRQLRSVQRCRVVRGKMLLSLYCSMLTEFIRLGYKKDNGRILKSKFQIGRKNYVHIAASLSGVPDSLRDFFTGRSVIES